MDGLLIDPRRSRAAEARDAEINGAPQRIEPLPQDGVPAEVCALIKRVHDSIGADNPSEIDPYFRTMAKHPELLCRQLEMGAALFTGRLPARERELAVLRVAWLLGAPYEWGEHVLIAGRCGVSGEEIERVTVGAAAAGWSAHEAAILGGVEELLSNQTIGDATWARLAESWTEAQLIEFPMMIGQYVATALVQNALRIRLSADNPGLASRR